MSDHDAVHLIRINHDHCGRTFSAGFGLRGANVGDCGSRTWCITPYHRFVGICARGYPQVGLAFGEKVCHGFTRASGHFTNVRRIGHVGDLDAAAKIVSDVKVDTSLAVCFPPGTFSYDFHGSSSGIFH